MMLFLNKHYYVSCCDHRGVLGRFVALYANSPAATHGTSVVLSIY